MIGLLIFIAGLCLGSFYNVCIYRIPRGESIIFPPSHCTNCTAMIKRIDLIPVLSWIFLKGRCRECHVKISSRYACIELGTGILFVLIYYTHGLNIKFISYAILSSLMIVIGMIDYDTTDVYTKLIFFALALRALFSVIYYLQGAPLLTFLLGGLAGYLIVALIIILTRGMGWGDAEILGIIGLFLGLNKMLLTLFMAIVFGGVVGMYLIASKKQNKKDYIAFGPFLMISTFVVILFGDNILNWYLMILLK